MKRRHFLLSASVLCLSAFAPVIAFADGARVVLLPPWVTLPKAMTDTYKGGGLDIHPLGWPPGLRQIHPAADDRGAGRNQLGYSFQRGAGCE
jgi:hypothetical protein